MGARPIDPATMTGARMLNATQVLPVSGALSDTFCHRPTSGWFSSTSTERAVTMHISPGRAGVSRSSSSVSAAITSTSSSSSRSRMVACSSVAIDTM